VDSTITKDILVGVLK